MFNLALIPLILIISVLLIVFVSYLIYKKIKRGIEFTVKKSSEFATEQQQKWESKEKQKKQPEPLQKAFKTYDEILANVKELPNEWKTVLEPLMVVTKVILNEVEEEAVEPTDNKRVHIPTKLNSIRPFFNHSLNALLQFTQKIKTNHKMMDSHDKEKAWQNINIIKADLLGHKQTLDNARKMDFDVTMDVIKARLKK